MPGAAWTAGMPLPGGDFGVDEVVSKIAQLKNDYPFLQEAWAKRFIRAYGTEAWQILGDAQNTDDLGHDFGATLTEAEVTWLMTREYAKTADDILWRRSKLGLKMSEDQKTALADWLDGASPSAQAAE